MGIKFVFVKDLTSGKRKIVASNEIMQVLQGKKLGIFDPDDSQRSKKSYVRVKVHSTGTKTLHRVKILVMKDTVEELKELDKRGEIPNPQLALVPIEDFTKFALREESKAVNVNTSRKRGHASTSDSDTIKKMFKKKQFKGDQIVVNNGEEPSSASVNQSNSTATANNVNDDESSKQDNQSNSTANNHLNDEDTFIFPERAHENVSHVSVLKVSENVRGSTIISSHLNNGESSSENVRDSTIISSHLNTGESSSENVRDSTIISSHLNTGESSSENVKDSTIISSHLNTGESSSENQSCGHHCDCINQLQSQNQDILKNQGEILRLLKEQSRCSSQGKVLKFPLNCVSPGFPPPQDRGENWVYFGDSKYLKQIFVATVVDCDECLQTKIGYFVKELYSAVERKNLGLGKKGTITFPEDIVKAMRNAINHGNSLKAQEGEQVVDITTQNIKDKLKRLLNKERNEKTEKPPKPNSEPNKHNTSSDSE